VFFYTDGLLDAYAPGRVVQPSDLEAVLRACAGRPPSEILGAMEESFLDSEEVDPRDDVAIVVLQVSR
jgi:serine phosphatase RsbU (regulator of sigma subunit)